MSMVQEAARGLKELGFEDMAAEAEAIEAEQKKLEALVDGFTPHTPILEVLNARAYLRTLQNRTTQYLKEVDKVRFSHAMKKVDSAGDQMRKAIDKFN